MGRETTRQTIVHYLPRLRLFMTSRRVFYTRLLRSPTCSFVPHHLLPIGSPMHYYNSNFLRKWWKPHGSYSSMTSMEARGSCSNSFHGLHGSHLQCLNSLQNFQLPWELVVEEENKCVSMKPASTLELPPKICTVLSSTCSMEEPQFSYLGIMLV